MAGYSAPGVYRKEIDLSEILVATGVSNGGTIIRAKKGPVRRPVLVTNDKEYIEAFGEPYYVSGLNDKNPFESAIGGSLVPELGYGAYGAIEFLKESNTLYVVRAFDDGDIYSTVEFTTNAECDHDSQKNGIVVSDSPLDVFDTREKMSTYDEYYRDGKMATNNLLVGYVGPGEDGNDYAITVETINPKAEWLYSFDDYPTETSATVAQYGYNVPEVWINGLELDTWVTSGDGEAIIYNTEDSSSVDTIPFVPENVSTVSDSNWEIYSALSGTDAQEVVPPQSLVQDSTYSNWTYTIDEDNNTWTISADVADDDPLALSATGTYYTNSGKLKGSNTEVENHFPIAKDVVKVSVYKKAEGKEWKSLYANKTDEDVHKLRNEPIEVFFGTMTPKLDADGNELFIERSINGNSKFIYVKANGSFATSASWDFDVTNDDASDVYGACNNVPDGEDDAGFFVYNNKDRFGKLKGGASTQAPGFFGRDAEFWKYFENRDELPVQILINPSFSKEDKLAVAELCNLRRDCIAANQVGNVKVLNYGDIIAAEEYGYPYASFMALYAGYSRIYDNYNDKYVYLPNSIFGASLYARVDRLTEPWYAPAGVARGTLSVLDQNKVFNINQIGKMYDRNINAIKFVQGSGFVMWGQKTAQLKTSALDRINVRRNLIFMQTNIERALNAFVFENNTQQTRLRVFSIIDEFLAGIKAGDGLFDYTVVCDESNNTPAVIDSNQLNVDIYVQPTKTIEFIQFTTIVTRTGVNFSDVQLKYA